ncbi:MAG: hypothetical protein WAL27_20755 [Cellulosimicrobium cellulans]
MSTDQNNPPPLDPLDSQTPPQEPPRKKGIGKRGKIAIGTTAALLLAVVVFISVPSQNAEACQLYESADQKVDDALMLEKEGVISKADARAVVDDLPFNIGIAAGKAHGDVFVEMQESFRYATVYEANPGVDKATVYYRHQSQVVEACSAARSPIDLK